MRDSDPPEQPPVLPWARGRTPVPSSAAEGQPPTGPGGARGVVTAASAIAAGLMHRGNLSDDSALRLLYLAGAAGATGRLGLVTERGRFVLHFRRGVLESATSDAAADALGAWLVRRGAISPEALARAEGLRERFAGDLVSSLVSFDAFRPARDLGLLQEQGGAVVTNAIGSERGTWEWAPGVVSTTAGFPLAARWGLVCEATRRLDPEAACRLLGGRLNRVASRTQGRVELAELKLMPQEARVAVLFDGRSTVAQLAAARPSEAATLVRTAFLLAETELLHFGDPAADAPPRTAPPAPSQAAPPRPAPPRPAAPSAPSAAGRPAPAAPAAAPAPPSDDRATLEALHRKLEAADHFEALGAKRNATVAQFKACYFQLAKRYHPDTGAADETPESKKLRADIFARVSEAWAVLGDDQARAAYLEELASSAGPPVDVSQIVKAEEIFRRATVLVRARAYAQALPALEKAIEIYPDEPEFGVWLAWTRFLLASDRPGQRAASSATIEAALERAPRCAAGYLFLAQMARLTGEVAAAERYVKRGLVAVPSHEELARERKFIEQKYPRK